MTERQGASHRITQTRPGGSASTDLERKTRTLKAAKTRTRNRVNTLESEYGAHDVPDTSSYFPKIQQARQAASAAGQAWAEHTRNT
jgi:hypothetical protein